MLKIVGEVVTDVMTRTTSRPVLAKQNDANSRFLNVHIQKGGKPVSVDKDAIVMLNVQRPDGSTGTFYGTVNADGTVEVELNNWVLGQAGLVSCDVSVVKEAEVKEDSFKLTTLPFYIEAERAICSDEEIIETEEYSVIIDLLNRTQEACETASEAAQEAVQVVEGCEEATNAANAAAETANQAASGVVTIEQNKQSPLKFWTGTNAEYAALVESDKVMKDCLYILTDDPEYAEIVEKLGALEAVDAGINEDLKVLNEQISNLTEQNENITETLETTNETLENLSNTFNNTVVPVSNGGTGATKMTTARNNLGMRYEVFDFTLPKGSYSTDVEFDANGITANSNSIALAQIIADSTSAAGGVMLCIPIVVKTANKITIVIRFAGSTTPVSDITGKVGVFWITNS